MARPRSELAERARVLAVDCHRVEAEAAEARDIALAKLKECNASRMVDVHVKGDEVQFLSTLTTVYRAIPAPEGSVSRFCDECVEIARRAMRKNHKFMYSIRDKTYAQAIYIHWYVLDLKTVSSN